MRKRLPIIFLLLSSLLLPVTARSADLEIRADGEYVMGAGETMAVAEERALKKAQQAAAEQAGAFVKSYSQVKNLTLTEDVVEVVANHSMKITVVERKKTVVGDLEAIRFFVRIKALVSTEEVEASLRKVREDAGAVESYKKLKAEYDRQAREIEALKKQLAGSGEGDRKQVLARISDEEKKFKAGLWLEKGGDYGLSPELALKAYNTALELNPDLAMAWAGRAALSRHAVQACHAKLDKGVSDCRKEIADLYQSLADVNRAIAMDADYAEAYALRAQINQDIRSLEWLVAYRKDPKAPELPDNRKNQKSILEDIDRAIALNPGSHKYYERRAGYLDPVDETEKRISDMTRAIELCRKENCDLLFMYYAQRAGFYEAAGKLDLAREDKRLSREAMKDFHGSSAAAAESEYRKVQEEVYFPLDEDRKAKFLQEAKQRISAGRAEAGDYWARAMLTDDDNARLADIAEAVRLAEKLNPRGREALKLAFMYQTRGAILMTGKKFKEALDDLMKALGIADQYLPQALARFKPADIAQFDNARLDRLTRPEAEAVLWIFLQTSALRMRANAYEELGSPDRALADYKALCTGLNDVRACKDVERLK